MWPNTVDQRLQSWYELRQHASTADLESALDLVNSWWFNAPWRPYHLHWDERQNWPDPWQLLSDNMFCPLARGLGILYTITMLNRPDIQDAELTDSDNDNLVLISNGKYILNWDPKQIVNTSLPVLVGQNNFTQAVAKIKVG
jgi:hypothetical protein